MLVNQCKYSFKDLLNASNVFNSTDQITVFLTNLYKLSQQERNKVVKELCDKAGWYWEDNKGSDGIIYTAFSSETV